MRVVSPEGCSANSGKELQKKFAYPVSFLHLRCLDPGAPALSEIGVDYVEGPLQECQPRWEASTLGRFKRDRIGSEREGSPCPLE